MSSPSTAGSVPRWAVASSVPCAAAARCGADVRGLHLWLRTPGDRSYSPPLASSASASPPSQISLSNPASSARGTPALPVYHSVSCGAHPLNGERRLSAAGPCVQPARRAVACGGVASASSSALPSPESRTQDVTQPHGAAALARAAGPPSGLAPFPAAWHSRPARRGRRGGVPRADRGGRGPGRARARRGLSARGIRAAPGAPHRALTCLGRRLREKRRICGRGRTETGGCAATETREPPQWAS